MEKKRLKDKIREVVKRDYQEKWIGKTITTIILSLLSIIIVVLMTLYRKPDIGVLWKRIIETLNTGTLFIVSLSLMSNIIRDRKNTAPINEYFIGILNYIAILIGILIAMCYGASYQTNGDKVELQNYQIVISLLSYITTIIIIGCFNFLNRTDALDEAVTNKDEDEIIQTAKSDTLDGGGMEV